MFVMSMVKTKIELCVMVCEMVCEDVNLKCEIMLFNHDKSQHRHKICDVSRNS